MQNEIILVVTLATLAIISPGADFAVVTRNALHYSKKSGYFTALGVALATWVHTLYCITGVAVVIAKTPMLFNFIKLGGAAYLVYLGIKSFYLVSSTDVKQFLSEDHYQLKRGLKEGFLSNATNPKTTLFYLSLFTMVINPLTPIAMQVFYGFLIFVLHLIWFGLVAYLINHPIIYKKINNIQTYLTKGVGVALLMISMGIIYGMIH